MTTDVDRHVDCLEYMLANAETEAYQEALEAAIRALRQGGEAWQSMDSAPKDGTPILVWFDKPGLGVLRVTWEAPQGQDDEWAIWCVDDNKFGPYALRGYSEGDAKAWQPLPPPPGAQP